MLIKKIKKRTSQIKYLIYFLIICLILIIAGFLYSGFLAAKVITRCQGTRWELPSKIYSSPIMLYPGLDINALGINQYLKTLGYRKVKGIPKKPGSFAATRNTLLLYQRSFDYPSGHLNARLVKIYQKNGVINRIVAGTSNADISSLQIEPMEIATLFGKKREERYLIDLAQVPQPLIDAVLAIEDRSFYEHGGLAWRSILRAFFKNLMAGRIKEGGSTLTQQLVKNMFLTPERNLSRKLNEALMAIALEWYYSKDEILEMYFNEIYLGQKGSVEIHGVGEAAKFYFGRSVENLDLDQSALLAGLIQAPNRYSPYRHKQAAIQRRNLVLKTLLKLNKITSDQYQEALKNTMETSSFSYGKAQAPYFVDYSISQIKELYSKEVLGSIGLSIFTTLDVQIQGWARETLQKVLQRLEKQQPSLADAGGLQAAVVVIEPGTGRILAMVGGRDYATSQFNRATHAFRQPGSLIKPLVYTEALRQGYTEVSILEDSPIDITLSNGTIWSPSNFNEIYYGKVPLIKALANSLNCATVRLARDVGFEKIYKLAFKIGLSKKMPEVPSFILGASEITPIEAAKLYSIFAANGFSSRTLSIRNVLDQSGNRLQMKRIHIKKMLDSSICEVMNNILQCATTYGTGKALASYDLAGACGKTGTSNNTRDAWFAGYINGYLAVVWVGRDDNGKTGLTGAQAALPIWANLMKKINNLRPSKAMRRNSDLIRKYICIDSGGIALWNCPHKWKGAFIKAGDIKSLKPCMLHKKRGWLIR